MRLLHLQAQRGFLETFRYKRHYKIKPIRFLRGVLGQAAGPCLSFRP
jgi:hypothetical protein